MRELDRTPSVPLKFRTGRHKSQRSLLDNRRDRRTPVATIHLLRTPKMLHDVVMIQRGWSIVGSVPTQCFSSAVHRCC